MKRHQDALFIQQGACNPSAIAHSIISACREVREEMDKDRKSFTPTTDPAIRLMVHQLAYICSAPQIDRDLALYSDLTAACVTPS